MPTYSFRDKNTGQEFEQSMKIAELDPFLKKNKHLEQILTKINIGDPWQLGVTKPPSDFSKYVLGRVKSTVSGANIERGRYHVEKEI